MPRVLANWSAADLIGPTTSGHRSSSRRSWYQRSLTRLRQSWSSSRSGSDPSARKAARPLSYWRPQADGDARPALGPGGQATQPGRRAAERERRRGHVGSVTGQLGSRRLGSTGQNRPQRRDRGRLVVIDGAPGQVVGRLHQRVGVPGPGEVAGGLAQFGLDVVHQLGSEVGAGQAKEGAGLLDVLAGLVDRVGVGAAGATELTDGPVELLPEDPTDLDGGGARGIEAVGPSRHPGRRTARHEKFPPARPPVGPVLVTAGRARRSAERRTTAITTPMTSPTTIGSRTHLSSAGPWSPWSSWSSWSSCMATAPPWAGPAWAEATGGRRRAWAGASWLPEMATAPPRPPAS